VVTLFRNKSYASIFLLIILVLVVHIHFFITDVKIITHNDGVISFLLQKYIQPLPNTFKWLLYIILLLLQAIRLNLVLNENKLFNEGGYTVAMTYILLSGFIIEFCSLSTAFVANSIIVLIIIMLNRLYNNSSPKALLFNMGFIIGIVVLAYHPMIILLPLIFFATLIIRPFRASELLVLFIGSTTPFYLLFSILFLTDQWTNVHQFLPLFTFKSVQIFYNPWLLSTIALVTLMLLSGFYFWLQVRRRMLIQIRKSWSILFTLFLIVIPIPVVFKTTYVESFILLLPALAAYIANVFVYPKRLFYPNFLFLLALIIIIHTNLHIIKN
jgi:hypothetical protein